MRKGIYGLRVKIRKRKRLLHERIPHGELTKSHQIGLGRILVKNMTVYAMMQPPEPPPPASMGVEEMGSASGELEVRVKSEAKESIVVYEYVG